jgi:hypothetical protein
MLPSVLGPADGYDVHIDGSLFSLARGHAKRVEIKGTDVQISQGLVLDSVKIDALDASFDTKAQRIKNIGKIEFTGTISQAHLTDYLTHHPTKVPGIQVLLRWSDVEAQVPISTIRTTGILDGTLAPSRRGHDKIDFTVSQARMGKLPLPASLVNWAVDHLNPVVDLSGLKVPISLDRVEVHQGLMTLTGTAGLPAELTQGS